MAYANVSDFKARYGAARAVDLVGTDDPDARILELLQAGSGRLNTALSNGGFTVPIVVSDLTDDAAMQTEITEQLEECNAVLAFQGAISSTGLTDRAKAAIKSCSDWLAQLRQGAGLPGAAPVSEAAPLFVEPVQRPSDTTFNPKKIFDVRTAMGLR